MRVVSGSKLSEMFVPLGRVLITASTRSSIWSTASIGRIRISTPWARPMSTRPADRSGERTARNTLVADILAEATIADAAVAPPPRMRTVGSSARPCRRNASVMPYTSVLNPRTLPPSKRTVLAEPVCWTRSDSESSSGSTSRFNGIVSDRPRHELSLERMNWASESPSISTASYCQSSPSAT